jgi:hypothetical protein
MLIPKTSTIFRLVAAAPALLALPAITSISVAAEATSTAKAGCKSAEHRQFDFWIGRWNVIDTKTRKPAGVSLIERVYGGCGIRENWRDPDLTGGSLNIYVDSDQRWHQFWIDSSGAQREFVGGLDSKRMILVSTHKSALHPGMIVQERMIFTPNPDGSVRQYSDASRDGGVTWVPRYDYTYRRNGKN